MLRLTTALAAALVATSASAASPFDGTWKTDMAATKFSTKPRNVLFKDGMYQCDCTPPIRIKADGQFHPISGNPYVDELSMKVIDDHHAASAARKKGKTIESDSYALAPDGQTVTIAYDDMSAANGVAVKGTNTLKRVGPAPAGAMPMSGAYVRTGGTSSEAGIVQTFRVADNMLHVTTPVAYSYDAPLDGKPVPIKGDLANTMASVKQAGPRTLVETDLIAGKPQTVLTMTVRPDGKTMDVTADNKLSNRVTKLVLRKQ